AVEPFRVGSHTRAGRRAHPSHLLRLAPRRTGPGAVSARGGAAHGARLARDPGLNAHQRRHDRADVPAARATAPVSQTVSDPVSQTVSDPVSQTVCDPVSQTV